MTERTSYGNAADIVATECATKGFPVGFGTLEDNTGRSVGIVLVCLSPVYVEHVVRFVHSLGELRTRVVQRGEDT